MKLFKRKLLSTALPVYELPVYELQRGGVYVVEYQESNVEPEYITFLEDELSARNITVYFVPNKGNTVLFTPMPATPKGEKDEPKM